MTIDDCEPVDFHGREERFTQNTSHRSSIDLAFDESLQVTPERVDTHGLCLITLWRCRALFDQIKLMWTRSTVYEAR